MRIRHWEKTMLYGLVTLSGVFALALYDLQNIENHWKSPVKTELTPVFESEPAEQEPTNFVPQILQKRVPRSLSV